MMKFRKSYSNPVGVGKFTGLLLISPFIIGFAAFTLYPLLSALIEGLTVTQHGKTSFGFDNFIAAASDSSVRKAAAVTLEYTVLLVPLKLIVSLLTAMLLNLEIKGMRFFRTVFYIPSILGANLSVVIMWQYLFTSKGLVNQLLGLIGISPVSWYGEPFPAMSIIVLLRLWEFGSTMMIFFAALRDIPSDYYDAARVDGCGKIRAFFKITLPLLKNVIFINLILQTVSAMQEFNAPYMITGGNPMKSTYTIAMLIYDSLFRSFNNGYGYAVSWILFAAIALIVGIMFHVVKKFGRNSQ
jgi:oligogalacturonide transport system permease protein